MALYPFLLRIGERLGFELVQFLSDWRRFLLHSVLDLFYFVSDLVFRTGESLNFSINLYFLLLQLGDVEVQKANILLYGLDGRLVVEEFSRFLLAFGLFFLYCRVQGLSGAVSFTLLGFDLVSTTFGFLVEMRNLIFLSQQECFQLL